MSGFDLIRGAGGGGGGGSEASDTVRGTQTFDVIDLISEGECEGLVNGFQSIYLDGVPLMAADGVTLNFDNVRIQTTPGTQGQAAIEGVDGVQNEIGVGINVAFATPLVRSITNPAIDTCRVTIIVPQLSKADPSTGDLGGSSFEWAIEVQSNGGGYVQVFRETISEKVMSRYPRAALFKLTGAAPWDVKVRRLSADSTSANEVNAFAWSTYTEIQTVKLRYPNSCLIRSRGNAAQFARVPVRSFDWLGMRIQVPSNYNPKTRVYTGVWDGTFKIAWTDNPAWQYHDMVVNDRYGLGRYIETTDVFKWELYAISRYCDELVPDGYGGMEPRFRASPGFETREQAYKVLTDMAAIFRGIVFWLNQDVSLAQDAPGDPVAHYAPANVMGEPGKKFAYTGSSNGKRYSSVIVWYNDLTQQGKLVPEAVIDRQLEAEIGVKPLELSPIGVWSRGQAHRIGQWVLYTQERETEAVTFKVGMDGVLTQPGKLFKVSDPHEAGDRMAGRVSAATNSQVTLDADVTLDAGGNYLLTVMLQDTVDATKLVPQQRAVTNAPGTWRTLTMAAPFSGVPARETMWLLESDQIAATIWRCVGLVETPAENSFTISGIAHQPAKYALIEQGIEFKPPSVSKILLTPPKPTPPLRFTEAPYLSGSIAKSRVTVSWIVPALGLSYLLRWRLNAGPWTEMPWSNDNAADIDGLAKGLFEASVRSRNALGNVSTELTGAVQLLGWTKKPANVANFRATVVQGGVRFEWDANQADNYLVTTLKIGSTIIFEGAASSWLWPWPAFGIYDVTAIHWDTSLNFSETPATAHVVVDVSTLTQWANLGGIPANIAGLTGTEAIRNADIVVGGVNLLTRSNDFATFDRGGGSIIRATGLPDPMGGASATRLALVGNADGERYRHVAGLRVGGTYTMSVWVNREGGDNFCLSVTNAASWSGSVGAVSTAALGTWKRLVVTFTTPTGEVDLILGGHSVPNLTPQSPATVLLAFAQLEEGNTATQWGLAPEDISALISGAQAAADAANLQLVKIADNNVLDRSEKPDVLLDWNALANDQPGILAQASAYGITTERTAFNDAVAQLAAYLASIGPGAAGWQDASVDSPIDRAVFIAKWAAAYAAEQTLLNKISQVAGTLANWSTVNNRPQDLFNMVLTPTFESGEARTWGAPVVDVSGASWKKSLFVNVRDVIEQNDIPVRENEVLYCRADLASRSAYAMNFGFVAYNAAAVVVGFVAAGGVGPGQGFSTVGSGVSVPATAVKIRPWLQVNGPGATDLGYNVATNLFIGRAQPGATLGADWATNVTGAAAVNQAISAATVAANLAQAAADRAQSAANTANTELAAWASDNLLSRIEKPGAILDWNVIYNERDGIETNAATYALSSAAYHASIDDLGNYLSSLGPYGWSDLNGDTPIVGTTFRAKFGAVYTQRQALLNAISIAAKNRLGALATLNQVGTDQIGTSAVSSRVVFTDAAGIVYSPGA